MRALQAMLALYGYGLDLTGVYDRRTLASRSSADPPVGMPV